jgi:hypothetical protein
MHIKYTSAGLHKYVSALAVREEETSGEYKNISLQHTVTYILPSYYWTETVFMEPCTSDSAPRSTKHLYNTK